MYVEIVDQILLRFWDEYIQSLNFVCNGVAPFLQIPNYTTLGIAQVAHVGDRDYAISTSYVISNAKYHHLQTNRYLRSVIYRVWIYHLS